MKLDFTTIEKQAKLLQEEQEKIEQRDHEFQVALDKHRESLKNLFKDLSLTEKLRQKMEATFV